MEPSKPIVDELTMYQARILVPRLLHRIIVPRLRFLAYLSEQYAYFLTRNYAYPIWIYT